MAERIVSPGVFTREKDLSFLPQGISEIGAAIIGPTVKGPSFVPTIIRSFEQFEQVFGSYNSEYYTPYTVKEYLRSAGTVTIIKVGYIGGYSVGGFNLLVSGSQHHLGENGKIVVASFLPAINNSNGTGALSGSIKGQTSASNFTLELAGANATASLTNLSILTKGSPTGENDAVSGNYILRQVPTDPKAQSIGSTEAPGYMYKFFESSVSASFASGIVSASNAGDTGIFNNGRMFTEDATFNFAGGTETVNTANGNYITTITGNSDAASARTPFIQSQLIGGSGTDLFKVYMRADGTDTNHHYVVIRDVKRPQGSNSSPSYAQFGLSVYRTGNPAPIESYSSLNMDPDSSNYIVKVIGDMFQTVNNNGEITVYGDYPNLSQIIRIGDYKEDLFKSNTNLQPMGHAAVLDPIVSTNVVPTASFSLTQTADGDNSNTGTYKEFIPYGVKLSTEFAANETSTNYAYLAPISSGETKGSNVDFSLENMFGYGDNTSFEFTNKTNFAISSQTLTISQSVEQLKFSVPMQHGFDGINPAASKNTGTSISSTNSMGFDMSSTTASGSIAYKRAINAIANPDDYDINMLVTPGVIHKHHSVVTNHAIDKVEERADAFYVLDSSDIDDNVATAVDNIVSLDTNYVATYYPWVKIENPAGNGQVWVPPSVVIPGVIAFTDSVAHEWFAPAGLNRGGLSNVRMTKKKLTHTDRDTLYEGRVNPIASFPGQGVVVFGQKTLQAKPSALDRINVRRLLIRLKKFIASSSRFLVFEQNDSSTRARFLNIVNPFLESVQSNSGLSAFKVVMDDSNNTPDVVDRNQLVGQIFIQPTRTAEFIVLDFSVLPTGAAFPE